MISARTPFLNKDGTVTAPWFQFFQGLYPLTNGGVVPVGVTPDDVLIMHRQDAEGAHDEIRRLANDLEHPRKQRTEKKGDVHAPGRTSKTEKKVDAPMRRQRTPKLFLTKASYQPGTLIQMYKGTSGNIPAGWQLADGTNGTPNLKDLFIVGAGNLYSLGSSGGSTTITSDNLPTHTHGYDKATANTASNFTTGGTGTAVISLTQTDTQSDNNMTLASAYLQPYYALSYIINTSVITYITNAELK